MVKRDRVSPPGFSALYSDLADVTQNILYEAKGSADRMSVRLALGQVLDYGRYVDGAQLAVLLPEAPAADLVELLRATTSRVVGGGNTVPFLEMTKLERCP